MSTVRFVQVLIDIVRFYEALIFIRILASWFPNLLFQSWMRPIRAFTDPYLDVFRRVIPPIGMMDFSPIVALLVLQMLIQIIVMSAR